MLSMNITDAQVRTTSLHDLIKNLNEAIILVFQWEQLGIRYVNKLFSHLDPASFLRTSRLEHVL